MEHLELGSAREALQKASLQEGVFEEDVGEQTAQDSAPKVDCVTEIQDKLGGFEEEADDRETIEYISDARDDLREHMRERSKTDQ
jgi:hypothetical protein